MVQCPSCGGSFSPVEGDAAVVCPYCGIHLDEVATRPKVFDDPGLDSLAGSLGDDDAVTQLEVRTRADRAGTQPETPAGKRTLFGSPNPFAHDSIAEQLPSPEPSAPPAPAAGKRTLFGVPAPVIAAAPPPPVNNQDEAERRREERERYAAARLAAAAAVQRRRATTRRIRAALIALIVLGVAALIVASVLLATRGGFQAEIEGDLAVVREADGYRVKVRVATSAPATVAYPGGEVGVDKRVDLDFSVPEKDLEVGDNEITLTVTAPGSPAVPLSLHVTVYYRLTSAERAAPREGRSVEAELQLIPGWTVEVRGGEVTEKAPGKFTLAVDPGPLLDQVDDLKGTTGELPIALTLRGPEGAVQSFAERLTLPLPATPLFVFSPPPGRITTAEAIEVEGRTSPGASVAISGVYGRANGSGVFSLSVPLEAIGEQTLDVRADGRRRTPFTTQITVTRLARGDWRARTDAVERAAKDWLGRQPRAPDWSSLVKNAAKLRGRKVALTGSLIAVRRAPSGGVEAQIDLCRGRKACPVWANFDQVDVFSSAGEKATLYGTLDGTREYQTAGGDTITVPLLVGQSLVP